MNNELLFSASHSALYQCDDQEIFRLEFRGDSINFRPCELIAFKRKIQRIDLTSLLSSSTPDIEIVSLPHCDRLFVLTVNDVLELRSVFAGAFTMLELNSVIHKELVRKVL